MMTPDEIRALRAKLETDRATMLAEIEQRARGGEVTVLRPLTRIDRVLLEAGLTLADLAATEALVEHQRQRRDDLFEESRRVASKPRDAVTVLPQFPFLRTWNHPSEAERRRKG